jgi:hypothetical protein
MDMKILLEKLSEVTHNEMSDLGEMKHVSEKIEKEEDEAMTDETFKIKVAVGFERLASLLFIEEDMKIGRIALRKVLMGKQETMNLRERNVMANSLVHLLPVVAGDRTVFSRIERGLEKTSAEQSS